jgi:predicted amidohydrolase
MKVTLVQFAPKLNRSNLATVCDIVQAYKDGSDLIVFPELALSGYLLQDKLFEDAWHVEELNRVSELSKDVDIVVGAALRDEGGFRNTALYFNNGRLISKHYKLHLPNYGMFEEARYFKAGDVFESFMVKNKKISMVVCEDLWHEEVHHDLMAEDPDMIIALVASPARGFNDKGLSIEDKWYEIIKTVAKECRAKLIFVNRVGFEDGLGFWGGSCVVDESGEIIKKLPHYEEIIKTIDIKD